MIESFLGRQVSEIKDVVLVLLAIQGIFSEFVYGLVSCFPVLVERRRINRSIVFVSWLNSPHKSLRQATTSPPHQLLGERCSPNTYSIVAVLSRDTSTSDKFEVPHYALLSTVLEKPL